MILFYLFALVILVPIIELALLIELGRAIGTGATMLVIIGTGVLGFYCARSQGFATLMRVQREIARGEPPTEGLVDGFLILSGGILLVIPGLLTDVIGLVFVLPATRRAIKLWLRRRLENWIRRGTFHIFIR